MGKNPCRCICENKAVGYSCMFILFLLGIGCIIQIFYVSPAVNDAFLSAVTDRIVMTQQQQDDNTEDYQNWESNYGDDAPLQLFEYWIYNVTNPNEVPNGIDPTFDLVGPFTFRRFENKSGPGNATQPIFFEEEDESIVLFEYQYHFEYDESRSTNVSLDEYVYALSGAVQGFFANINQQAGSGPFPLGCVDRAFEEFPGNAIFYHVPIRNLTYGVRDPFIEGEIDEYCANDFFWPFVRPNTFFSLLADGINGVIQHTGKQNISRVGELEQFRNVTTPEVNSWKLGAEEFPDLWLDHNETVAGARETRNFPPDNWINKDRELLVWSIEKFRVTKYVYQKDVTFKGVELMRFRLADPELYACEYYKNSSCSQSPTPQPTPNPTPQPSSSTEPPSISPTIEPTLSPTIPTLEPTFEPTDGTTQPTIAPTLSPTCTLIFSESETCKYYQHWEDGIANLTNLRGSPSFMSKGRFLDAPYFIEDTNRRFGLAEPDPEEDDQYFDVDPRSGIVFRNFHNYQMNFRFIQTDRPYPNNFSNFSIYNKLIPFAYVRVEAIATDEQMEFYKETLDQIDLINGFSLYGGPALAVVLFGFMFLILCGIKRQKSMRGEDKYGRLVEDMTSTTHRNQDISMQGAAMTSSSYGATTPSKEKSSVRETDRL